MKQELVMNLLYLHDSVQPQCLLQYTCSLCIHLLKMLKTAWAESVQVKCVMKENEPVTQLCSTPGKLQELTLAACYSPLSNTLAHTNSADTPSWQNHANLHLLHFFKIHEKWLINIKSRNQICFKLAGREWLSQQKVPTALSLTQIHDAYLSVTNEWERTSRRRGDRVRKETHGWCLSLAECLYFCSSKQHISFHYACSR